MTMQTRRTILKGGLALAALPALSGIALGQEKLKVGFAYLAVPGDYGWTYAHDQGANDLAAALGDKVEVTKVENVGESGPNVERVLRELAQQGHKLIFATTFGHMEAAVKVSAEFPDVIFEHCTGYMTGPNLGTYNARFYEGRAVIGTIAGHMSKKGVAGYIASFPIPEVVMGMNAFLLAARKVNPNSDMAQFGPEHCLTSIVDNWGPHYIKTAEEVLAGTWKPEQPWEGLKEGGLIVSPYNKNVPADVVAAADAVKNGQIDGSFHIFRGPLTLKNKEDSSKDVTIADGVAPDDGVLLGMQAYADGVEVIV